MTQKYLFLDMDGVLNSMPASWNDPKCRAGSKPTDIIDPVMVQRLNTIVKEMDFKVVLSSTWRIIDGVVGTQEMLNRQGAEFDLIDKTPTQSGPRGREIKAWMEEHEVEPEQIVILDDDSDMATLMDRLVQTSMKTGLQDEHLDQIRELFKEE